MKYWVTLYKTHYGSVRASGDTFDTEEEARKYLTRFINPIGVGEVEIPRKRRPYRVGETVKTKGGNDVLILHTDRKSKNKLPVVGLVMGDDHEHVFCWAEDGSYYGTHTENCSEDLEPVYEDG